MGMFSKFLKPGAGAEKPAQLERADESGDDDFVLGGATQGQPAGPVEKRGAEKRRHPRVVQTTVGGPYGAPRFWVYGDRECYEDPNDAGAILSLDEAKAKAALTRPDLEGKVELPRYLKRRAGQ